RRKLTNSSVGAGGVIVRRVSARNPVRHKRLFRLCLRHSPGVKTDFSAPHSFRYGACIDCFAGLKQNHGQKAPIGRTWSVGRRSVKATMDWHLSSGTAFSAGLGRTGTAHLKHYNAQFCVWGDGPPLVLVPGLAGGYELLGPLARLLAQHFRV